MSESVGDSMGQPGYSSGRRWDLSGDSRRGAVLENDVWNSIAGMTPKFGSWDGQGVQTLGPRWAYDGGFLPLTLSHCV